MFGNRQRQEEQRDVQKRRNSEDTRTANFNQENENATIGNGTSIARVRGDVTNVATGATAVNVQLGNTSINANVNVIAASTINQRNRNEKDINVDNED